MKDAHTFRNRSVYHFEGNSVRNQKAASILAALAYLSMAKSRKRALPIPTLTVPINFFPETMFECDVSHPTCLTYAKQKQK